MPAVANRCLLLVAFLLMAYGCATPTSTSTLPRGLAVDPAVNVPSDVALGFYLPPSKANERHYISRGGYWVNPGIALEEAANGVLGRYFSSIARFDDADADSSFGLLVALQPDWAIRNNALHVTLDYRVYDPQQQMVLSGSHQHTGPIGNLQTASGFFTGYVRTIQHMVVELLNTLGPDAGRFPAAGRADSFPVELLVHPSKPVQTGTGFFINHAGQVLTAAHVISDCQLIRIQSTDRVVEASVRGRSEVLDVAVLDTGLVPERVLPLRASPGLRLGEPIISVSYPLQELLADSPSFTRGNVSSFTAIRGSWGQFQFSAPIQPGASGGAVVSGSGELLGMTVGTLNVSRLIESGRLPQNVNFALDARHVGRFLERHAIQFELMTDTANDGGAAGDAAALAATVRVTCFD